MHYHYEQKIRVIYLIVELSALKTKIKGVLTVTVAMITCYTMKTTFIGSPMAGLLEIPGNCCQSP